MCCPSWKSAELKKVRQRCGEVWKFAIITGRAEYNPAPDPVSVFVPHKREHYAHLSVNELPEFLSSVDKYMGSQIVRAALRILILTGVRPGELRKAEWSEINFDNYTREIPADKMRMRRQHIVHLSEQVTDLLKQIQPISGSYQYVFPGRTDYKKHIPDMALNTISSRMGTGQGNRSWLPAYHTILHEQGYNTAWIETQLAHVDKNSIRGTYNLAQYIGGRREMLQWYTDYMDAPENSDNVVHSNFKRT